MARTTKSTAELLASKTSGFTPVTITKAHDIVGVTLKEWCDRFKRESLPSIPAERDRTPDFEALSAIYRTVAVALEPYLKDSENWVEPPLAPGAPKPSMSRSSVRSLISSIVLQAKECKPLSQTQLLILLPDAMRYLYEEEDVFLFFEEIEEAEQTEEAVVGKLKGFHALTSDRKEYWVQYMTVEVAEQVMSVVQECIYEDLEEYASTISGFSYALTEFDRVQLAFKYGASKCNESNYRQLELQGLAKCLGSIDPVEYRWIEPLENFRSRAWVILEDLRTKIEQAVLPTTPELVPPRFPMLELATTSNNVEELRLCISKRDPHLLWAIMRRRSLPAGIARECDAMMGNLERGEV